LGRKVLAGNMQDQTSPRDKKESGLNQKAESEKCSAQGQ